MNRRLGRGGQLGGMEARHEAAVSLHYKSEIDGFYFVTDNGRQPATLTWQNSINIAFFMN